MTPAQKTALANPCLLASEAAHPRFTVISGLSLILRLTVNAGYE